MEIAAVQQSDIDRGAPQRARRIKAAKAAAEDDYAFAYDFSITKPRDKSTYATILMG
jgi:hypothetical protein